ncbi:MAG: hypothetical protein ACTSPV_08660 [Candidatus Hodarchaeales archaeon]
MPASDLIAYHPHVLLTLARILALANSVARLLTDLRCSDQEPWSESYLIGERVV